MKLRTCAKAALLLAGTGLFLARRKTPYERALLNPRLPLVFQSETGQQRYEQAYAAMLSRWPVSTNSIWVPTRFGQTHVLAVGPIGAPPVILLHAAGVSAIEWYGNVAPLSELFRVYALDTVGDCGRTKTIILPRSREDYADWLKNVMEGLGIERAHLVGHSFGGFLAINFAVHHPTSIHRLVLLAPAGIYPFRPIIRLLLRRAGSLPFFRPAARSTLQRMAHKHSVLDPDFVRLMETVVADCTPLLMFPETYSSSDLEQLRSPTLLLFGDVESIYNSGLATNRARQFIRNLHVVVIPDAGHLLNMEQSEAVNREIVSFLNSESLQRPTI